MTILEAPKDLMEAAAAVAGSAAVRPGAEADAIDGVVPRLVVEPHDAHALARTLAWADDARLSVVPRGGGTKIGSGAPPTRLDVILSTRRLDRLIDHCHGDLTATVQAGASLAAMNRELARHGQWIPLDPPWSGRATIGGIIAAADSGPRRQRYGAPRDSLIGIEIVRADGKLARAGGRVVKNVAGYDLAKLMCGSLGSLAVIVGATFKLAPRPPASRTVVFEDLTWDQIGSLALQFGASQLQPSAIEMVAPPARLLVRFETVEKAAERSAAEAIDSIQATAGGIRARIVSGGEEGALWDAVAARPWGGPGAVIKVSLLPAELTATLSWLADAAATRRVDYEVVGRAGLGVLLLRLDGAPAAQAELVSQLRGRFPPGLGSAVILRGDPELKKLADVWGPIGNGLAVMRAVKSRFDQNGILSPGRGPGGI